MGSVAASLRLEDLVGFALDGDEQRIDGDRLDAVAAGGCAAEHWRDGQRAAPEVAEHSDPDVRRGGLDVDGRHPVAEGVDGDEIDVPIDVQAARLDDDGRLDLGDAVHDRGRARDRHRPGRHDGRPDVEAFGVGPWMTWTGIPSRTLSGSRVTLITRGSKSTTVKRASTDWTRIGTGVGPPCGSTLARSIVAWKLSAEARELASPMRDVADPGDLGQVVAEAGGRRHVQRRRSGRRW